MIINKKKLLLLSCGTNAAYHLSKVIKEKFSDYISIIGADINEAYLVPSIHFTDIFFRVPPTKDNSYYNVILEICRQQQIDYILPSFDMDQKLFFPENADLINLSVKSLSTPKDSLFFCADKKTAFKILDEKGFKVPKTFKLEQLIPRGNYFVKPVDGCASVGAEIMSSENILKFSNIENYIIQELCYGPEITLECFCYDGEFSSCARERISSKAGVCVKSRVFKDIFLEEISRRFAQIFKLSNFFNLQFMKNATGETVITDVNLRMAGGMSMSCAAGWDEASAIINILLNKSTREVFETLKLNTAEQYVVRAYTDIITKRI